LKHIINVLKLWSPLEGVSNPIAKVDVIGVAVTGSGVECVMTTKKIN